MNVSAVSSSTTTTSSSQTEVENLKAQMKTLQKKLTKINSSQGDAETKQQQVELIQSQIQNLELRIMEIEKKSGRKTGQFHHRSNRSAQPDRYTSPNLRRPAGSLCLSNKLYH